MCPFVCVFTWLQLILTTTTLISLIFLHIYDFKLRDLTWLFRVFEKPALLAALFYSTSPLNVTHGGCKRSTSASVGNLDSAKFKVAKCISCNQLD